MRSRADYGRDSERNTLMVVNPREEVLGDFSDQIVRAVDGYEGEVYRADNIERIGDFAEFHKNEEELIKGLYEIAEYGEHVDPLWYDDAFLFDEGGLDFEDRKAITRQSPNLEFLGGPLEDIATVISSIEAGNRQASYVLNRNLAFDYGGWDIHEGPVEDELMSLGKLLEADEEGLEERFRHHRLDRDNVHF